MCKKKSLLQAWFFFKSVERLKNFRCLFSSFISAIGLEATHGGMEKTRKLSVQLQYIFFFLRMHLLTCGVTTSVLVSLGQRRHVVAHSGKHCDCAVQECSVVRNPGQVVVEAPAQDEWSTWASSVWNGIVVFYIVSPVIIHRKASNSKQATCWSSAQIVFFAFFKETHVYYFFCWSSDSQCYKYCRDPFCGPGDLDS